ncbi:MAG: cupin domain-containing protein [Chloroflexi bacterium]|nr:cupin domain-containing protein [Chloroflexota bacterium]
MEKNLPRKTEKPWGYELLFAHTDKYAGKVMFVKKGRRASLQYHNQKDETMYVFQGKLLMEIERAGQMVKSEVSTGASFHVSPLTKHRMTAIEDTFLFEVSTPELDDVVRIADDYGRA